MTEFEEYLRGTFEINNGIENDVDTLVRIHAPELLELAKKELMKDAIEGFIEGELGRQEDEPNEVYVVSDSLDTTKFKIGDKVKVIIIKE